MLFRSFLLHFNYVKMNNLNSSFCFKEFLRDIKLKSVLENKTQPKFFLINIDEVEHDRESLGDHWRQITIILTKIEEGFFDSIRQYLSDPPFKILITCTTYESIRDDNHHIVGNKALYMSDLGIVFHRDVAKVVKSRFVKDGENLLYSIK